MKVPRGLRRLISSLLPCTLALGSDAAGADAAGADAAGADAAGADGEFGVLLPARNFMIHGGVTIQGPRVDPQGTET